MSPRTSPPTAADLHRSWLELVDTDGPFLSVPVLRTTWPQGIPQPSASALGALKDARPAFEKAWDNWDSKRDDAALDLYREARDAWAETVLRDVFGWKNSYVSADDGAVITAAAGTTLEVRSPDHVVAVRPTGALVHGDTTAALVLVTDPVDSLRDPMTDGWAASPVDRMEELLRAAKVTIGVVTDGRWCGIVSARPDTMVASGIVDSQDWISQSGPRNAFLELLRRQRLLGGKPEERLPELFKRSVAAAEDITEALGTQVRRAVELLVQAMSEATIKATAHDAPDPLPADREQVYSAAVTVMMRVVFLLFAEERGLLPTAALFTEGYGISDELDKLDERIQDANDATEILDASHHTWHRLLATSQALFRGASFEDIRIPSYGGSLFDPARFPFLTARNEHGTLAVTVSDRVMVEVLRAVQIARLKGEPARRISFRDIDVEQIGYIYEGLLGYSCADVDTVTIGLPGKEGEEPEIPLTTLEALWGANSTDAKRADAILAWCKTNQPAAVAPSKSALAKLINAEVEDTESALRSVTSDEELRDRLRPFIGIIRRDLRNRPFVVLPGGVLVVETPSRASAGAHYTPKSLAEEVVRYALEPLVYSPGPHQEPDPANWVPIASDQILDLKIADIACGSGAFLVAAARYLADRLVEAWQREQVARGTPHEMRLHAMRTVIASCLYGADINAMAVEMCKLSLWLVSLDPKLPFSFVDDKVLHGNALLGLTDVRQLKRQHINPDEAEANPSLYEVDVDGVVARATRLRRQLATEVDDTDPQRSTATKRRLWREYQELTADLSEIADGVIAAGLRLGGRPGKQLNTAYANLSIAIGQAYPGHGQAAYRRALEDILEAGLTPTVPTDYDQWKPLHWILAVPDVMERGGFDAIIGNPPFVTGSDITGAMGTNVRDWLVNNIADGQRGNADLVAYFFLRAAALLCNRGNIGLIATNSIAQVSSRLISLEKMTEDGFTITRSIQSSPWPSSATVEYAAVWGTFTVIPDDIPRVSDGIPVKAITTLLEPVGRIVGSPVRLAENLGIVFEGCKPNGEGFLLESDEARDWVAKDPRYGDVLFPFLIGNDVTTHPESAPSRWIIDFNDRDEEAAKKYDLPYRRLLERVKPEREKNNRKAYRDYWWIYAERRPGLRRAIDKRRAVIVLTITSKTIMPVRSTTGRVFGNTLDVFALSGPGDLALLSSSLHQLWAIHWGYSMRNDPRYSPSEVFEKFPRPESTDHMTDAGAVLDIERSEMMRRRSLGLTKLYNMVNDPDIADSSDADVKRLREIHVELDHAVMEAYGWGDVDLNHGFHTYRRMRRWTVDPAARVEILDRLLEENLRRAAAQGDAPQSANDDEEGGDE